MKNEYLLMKIISIKQQKRLILFGNGILNIVVKI